MSKKVNSGKDELETKPQSEWADLSLDLDCVTQVKTSFLEFQTPGKSGRFYDEFFVVVHRKGYGDMQVVWRAANAVVMRHVVERDGDLSLGFDGIFLARAGSNDHLDDTPSDMPVDTYRMYVTDTGKLVISHEYFPGTPQSRTRYSAVCIHPDDDILTTSSKLWKGGPVVPTEVVKLFKRAGLEFVWVYDL